MNWFDAPSWLKLSSESAGPAIGFLTAGILLLVSKAVMQYYAHSQRLHFLATLLKASTPPIVTLVLVLTLRSLLAVLRIPDPTRDLLKQILAMIMIASIGWLISNLLRYSKNIITKRYDTSLPDNFRARKIHTQFSVLHRIVQFFIIVITLSLILMTFESIRNLGTSLLASAGVAGVVLGFAAQKTIGSIFAGIQIAITQPIKLEDAVVIEGEWGWIEEITLTYVVVKIWDLRRLIVPITYFIEKPIQNWTRREAEIIGSVTLYTDYQVPLDDMRVELTRLLKANPRWNGNVNVLQVVEATPNSIQLRALMTARDSPTAWDLRCDIREGLITWLRKHYPDSLPRTRMVFETHAPLMPMSSD